MHGIIKTVKVSVLRKNMSWYFPRLGPLEPRREVEDGSAQRPVLRCEAPDLQTPALKTVAWFRGIPPNRPTSLRANTAMDLLLLRSDRARRKFCARENPPEHGVSAQPHGRSWSGQAPACRDCTAMVAP